MLETLAHRCKMYAWQNFYGLVCYVIIIENENLCCRLLQNIDCFSLKGAVALSKSSNKRWIRQHKPQQLLPWHWKDEELKSEESERWLHRIHTHLDTYSHKQWITHFNLQLFFSLKVSLSNSSRKVDESDGTTWVSKAVALTLKARRKKIRGIRAIT